MDMENHQHSWDVTEHFLLRDLSGEPRRYWGRALCSCGCLTFGDSDRLVNCSSEQFGTEEEAREALAREATRD